MVAIAVTVALRDIITAACVNRTRPVADPALIVCTDTVVFIIADAISILVRHAVPTTEAKCVKLVAIAIAVAGWNVGASALVDLAGTIAHATGVECAHAVVFVVTDAIGIFVRSTIATTHLQSI